MEPDRSSTPQHRDSQAEGHAAAERVRVTTAVGTVVGRTRDGVNRFLGIPYALAPVAERRFAAPHPAPAWAGDFDASEFGATAPQDPYPGELGELLGSVVVPGDNPLTVNVWAPTTATASAPVLLWLHGGALERGTPALPNYDGTAFARSGVVFVSLGYRLGAEGFSVFDDAPRNLGLQDVALGLAWVHANIARFGGDPARITAVGESAGGALVAALLSRPDTATLLAAGVIQSGPLTAESPKQAGRATRALAKQLGVAATREAFSRFSPEELIAARATAAAGASPLGGPPGWALALDPTSLPVVPYEALRRATQPILIGSNIDEYRLWFSPSVLAQLSPMKQWLARLALRIPRRARLAYSAAWPQATGAELLGQLITDMMLRRDFVATARARAQATFVYEFAWESPVRDLRAAHALDIGFVFDDLAGDESRRLLGDSAPQPLADEMHAAWVSFVRSYDPGWEPFAPAERVRRFATDSTTVALPRAAALATLPQR